MCNIAPAGVAPAATPVTAGGPTGSTQLPTDGVTPIPSILQPSPTGVGGVSGGGASAAPDLQTALQDVWGAIGSLQGALQGAGAVGTAPVTGGGPGGCGCGQVTQGPAQLGANAAPEAAQDDKPVQAPKPAEAPKPAAPVAPSTAPPGTKLTHPLPGAKLTSHFGEVASIRGGVPHTGTDYAKPLHTPVLAAASGKVKSVEFSVSGDKGGSGGGNIITIDHGNGFETRYMHLSGTKGPSVKVGDTVNAGQELAKVGSTGNSTGPHLHFMVVKDGKNQNAEPYVNGEKTF